METEGLAPLGLSQEAVFPGVHVLYYLCHGGEHEIVTLETVAVTYEHGALRL